MELHFGRVETPGELAQILALQRTNLKQNLGEDEKRREGFVTVSHTLDLLARMNAACPHIIARDGDNVVGYALCMHPGFSREIEVLKPMFREIKGLPVRRRNYIVMGQVCIARDYRKMGIFRNLYHTMLKVVQPEFDCIITEVDAANTRSLNAHYAIGFKELKKYRSQGNDWHVIILE